MGLLEENVSLLEKIIEWIVSSINENLEVLSKLNTYFFFFFARQSKLNLM